jgi:protein-disulfide isomerase
MKVLFVFLFLCVSSFAKSKLDIPLSKEALPSKQQLLLPFKEDFVLGNKNAKVTMIIFDSYSCFHCADFYKDTFPEIEKKYIKTGKINFIHKEFPLDKIALFATKVVHCSVNPFVAMNTIYKKQSSFFVKNYEEKLLALEGIDKSCVTNFNDNKIIKQIYQYSKVLDIHSTPTIYINGNELQKRGFQDISIKIDEILAK